MVKLRLDRLDKMLIAGASFTALAAFYFLFIDASTLSSGHQQNQEVIGKVIKRNQDVRRRLNQSLVWNKLKADDLLFESDSIFTGPSSGVEIKIGENQRIKVDPNSLIFLEKAPEGLVLDLQLGTISTQLANTETMRIKQGDDVATIHGEDASLRISRHKEKSLEFSSHESEFEFKLGDQTLILKADESLSVEEDKPIQKMSRPIKLLSPIEGSVLWEKDHAEFRWSGQTDRDLYIEIDDTIDFNNPMYRQLVTGQSHRVEQLQPGEIYYWRLVLDQSGLVASQIRSFELAEATAPRLLFPPEQFDSIISESSKKLHLTWTPVEHSEAYEVLISRTPNFSSPIRIETDHQSVSHIFEEGQFYWKVRSLRPSQLADLWSESRSFTLRNQSLIGEQKLPNYFPEPFTEAPAEELTIEGETLEKENTEEVVEKVEPEMEKVPAVDLVKADSQPKVQPALEKVEPRVPAAIPPLAQPSLSLPAPGTKILSMHDQNEVLIFKWTPVKEAEEYELQFAKDSSFERLYSTIKLKTQHWVFNGKPPKGKLYWRVRAVQSQERISEWSDSSFVQVLSYQTDKE